MIYIFLQKTQNFLEGILMMNALELELKKINIYYVIKKYFLEMMKMTYILPNTRQKFQI